VEEGIIERLVKRVENVPLVTISKEANEIAWKRHNYIPVFALEVQDILSQILGSNYVVETPNLTIADVEYRSWHSKTYCRNSDCLGEQQLYEKLVEVLEKVKRLASRYTTKPKEEVVKEWRHYCGASPIYHRYIVVVLRMPDYHYAEVFYNGGRCWHAEYYVSGGVYLEDRDDFLTDGCVDWEMFVNPPKPQP